MTTFVTTYRQGAFWVVNESGQGAVSFTTESSAQACAADLNAIPGLDTMDTRSAWHAYSQVINRHKDINRPAPPAPKKRLERDIQKDIVEYLEGNGLDVQRLNTGHVQTIHGSWVSLCKEGTPDVLTLLPPLGRAWYLETKTPAGRVSTRQTKRHAALRAQGAIVDVVRSVEEVEALYVQYRTVEVMR